MSFFKKLFNWTPLGAVVGLVTSIWAADKQSDAIKQQAAAMEKAAKPSIDAQKWAFPEALAAIDKFYGKNAGKESPLINRAYNVGLADLEKTRRDISNRSLGYWGPNTSQARGELIRANQAASKGRALLGLTAAQQQEAHKQSNIDKLINSYLAVAGQGTGGLGAAIAASNARIDAANAMYGGYGVLGGFLADQLDQWRDRRNRKKE